MVGTFLHPCQADIVCASANDQVPYFNAPIYLENKTQVGKVDDIFGPINERVCLLLSSRPLSYVQYFSVTLSEGVVPTSFKKEQKLYIDPMRLLPLSRFLPQTSSRLCFHHCISL